MTGEKGIQVPDFDALEEFPIEVDRSRAPEVVSVVAWAGEDSVRVTWDGRLRTASMVWTKDFQAHLVADRSDVSQIIVRPLGEDHVEIAVIWGDRGEERQLVARVIDPIEMTDTLADQPLRL